MECSYALVNFQDDNTVEIVQIEDVLSFDADKDGGEELDSERLHEVRYGYGPGAGGDTDIYAATILALASKYPIHPHPPPISVLVTLEWHLMYYDYHYVATINVGGGGLLFITLFFNVIWSVLVNLELNSKTKVNEFAQACYI